MQLEFLETTVEMITAPPTSKSLFACSWSGCKMVFKRNCDLVKHVGIHLNQNIFKCPRDECSFTCSSKSVLKSHSRSHPEFRAKTHFCTVKGCNKSYVNTCDKYYKSTEDLLAHQTREHPNHAVSAVNENASKIQQNVQDGKYISVPKRRPQLPRLEINHQEFRTPINPCLLSTDSDMSYLSSCTSAPLRSYNPNPFSGSWDEKTQIQGLELPPQSAPTDSYMSFMNSVNNMTLNSSFPYRRLSQPNVSRPSVLNSPTFIAHSMDMMFPISESQLDIQKAELDKELDSLFSDNKI